MGLGVIFLSLFNLFQRGRQEETEGEKHQCDRGTSIGCLLQAPIPGIKPTTQACALTGSRTYDQLVCRMMPNQLSHTSQGCSFLHVSCARVLLSFLDMWVYHLTWAHSKHYFLKYFSNSLFRYFNYMDVRLLEDVSQSAYAVYIFGSSCVSFEMVSIAISSDLLFFCIV